MFELFYIRPPMEWTVSQVCNIIQIIVAIATVATLYYVGKQGKENAVNIGNLATIAKSLAEQLQIEKHKIRKSVAPDFQDKTPTVQKMEMCILV